MSARTLDIGEPFFTLKIVEDEPAHRIAGKTIALNLGDGPIAIREQRLAPLQSAILRDTMMEGVARAVLIEGFADRDDEALMARIRETWPSAFEVRGEERLRGVEHYMSPKAWTGRFGFTLYHSASVPLNVGLHRDHPFCPVPGFREVHTQIAGFGKMQQCRECDADTLYLEEQMAPGVTHRPMYDAEGNYPWHRYETITPSVFLAVEILPPGAPPPA